jgi:hypothetical protein
MTRSDVLSIVSAFTSRSSDVAGVPAVLLVAHLAPGQVNLRGVDDDHVITDVEVRHERLLVLTAQD